MISLNIDMKEEINVQKSRYQQVIDSIKPQLDEKITSEVLKGIQKVYLVGCGDSLFASQGVRLFFEKVTGLDVEPVEGMEFSRYTIQNAKHNSLVLVVSNSGRVSRIIEAATLARKKGLLTIALTGHPDRDVASNSDIAIVAALPNVRATLEGLSSKVEEKEQDEMFSQVNQPGVIGKYAAKLGMGRGLDFLLFMLGAYNNSMLLLYSMAIKVGLVLETISPSQAEHYYLEIMHAVEAMVVTAIKNIDPVQRLAERFRAKNSFLYIGSGPAYAAAALSAAKLFEQPHLNGVSQYVEEWAHLQFFFTRPDGIPVFVLTPPGPSRGRALEQIDGIMNLGGTVIAVCNVEDKEVQEFAQETLLVYGDLPEEFIPWVYGVTGQLFAVTLLDLNGQPPIPAPYSFKKMMEINFKQIYASKIITNLVDQEN